MVHTHRVLSIIYTMLSFHRLHVLTPHITRLSEVFQHESMLVVGGCIRDILLGITDYPTDIDATCTGHPNTLRDTMHI